MLEIKARMEFAKKTIQEDLTNFLPLVAHAILRTVVFEDRSARFRCDVCSYEFVGRYYITAFGPNYWYCTKDACAVQFCWKKMDAWAFAISTLRNWCAVYMSAYLAT